MTALSKSPLPLLAAALLACVVRPVFAHLAPTSFPGYGFSWYDPVCGYACNNALATATLACTTTDMDMGDMAGMSMMGTTSPECRAGDSPFLTSLAYCMNSHCDPVKVPTWKRQQFWETQVTGDDTVLPKWSYSRALEQVGPAPPSSEFDPDSKGVLNQTVVLTAVTYENQAKFMVKFDYMEGLQARYIFVLLGVAVGTPIFFTYLTRLPFMTSFVNNVKPFWVYPSTIGTYNVRPLPWLLGNAPTIGQSFYIAMFVVLNVVLSAVNYSSSQPHPWGFGPREEMFSYIGYRTGHIAFGLLPLLILFSGRNNFLLWITNWSYATFLLLHRWIARIFTLHAIVHSFSLLITFKGSGSYPENSTQAYWIWGIVATVLACAMLILSHLYFRRLAYEAFLILHILLAAFVIIGCWYHIVLRWEHNFYMNWLYAACAVWAFDRVLRVLRLAKNGIRFAVVTEVGPDHVRVDVPDVHWANKPGQVAYAYFPSLDLRRPWENHPFSTASSALFKAASQLHSEVNTDRLEGETAGREIVEVDIVRTAQSDAKAAVLHVDGAAEPVFTNGVSLIIKKSAGLTRLLKSDRRLLTFLEGPYKQNTTAHILACDRVLLIGGGIGIMGLAAWTPAHRNVKLAWSIRASAKALLDEMGPALKSVVDKEVHIGERMDLGAILKREADSGYGKVGVVVCGPGGMCDEVRAVVASLGRAGPTVFELEVDAYSW
ncbi:hypothetical protein HDU88_007281 [Geranomyces variabilis]|nr:hypothetical protein HDU88_007281 [Geranomyces variabilis]